MTFANSKSGLYARGRGQPINRNSPAQQAVRTNFGNWANVYSTQLTTAQRAGWDTYAKNVKKLNPLGDSVQIPAISWFIGLNTFREQNGLSPIYDAPTTFNIGSYGAPALNVVRVSGPPTSLQVELTAVSGDTWLTSPDAGLGLYLGRPQNQAKSFFKGPYHYAGTLAGGGATTLTVPSPFSLPPNSRIPYRVNVSQADGRLGQEIMNYFDTLTYVLAIKFTGANTGFATLSTPAQWQSAQSFATNTTEAVAIDTASANTGTPSTTVLLSLSGSFAGDVYSIGGNFGLDYGGVLQAGITGTLQGANVLTVTHNTATTATVLLDEVVTFVAGDRIVIDSTGSIDLVATISGTSSSIPVTGANSISDTWSTTGAANYIQPGLTGAIV
jgi:hypothetical protein